MQKTSFKTNPIELKTLLHDCGRGRIKLPDFQRSWVWDEDRIRSLLASVSLGFPMGAVMALDTKRRQETAFAHRELEGAGAEAQAERFPDQLLLDGQQRLTSLFQTCIRQEVVTTKTSYDRKVQRWFYIDVKAALDPTVEREDAILAIPENRRLTADFGRATTLDLSTPGAEYRNWMFPLNEVFSWGNWQAGLWREFGSDPQAQELFWDFKSRVLDSFDSYKVPVIALGDDTPHAAVCLVFEKVNTGGKALDAFELVTAMWAAQGCRLRDDWLGTPAGPGLQQRLQLFGRSAGQERGVLEKVASTDMLQAVALLHAATIRSTERARGIPADKLSPVRATRKNLLELPLSAYQAHRESIEEGFQRAARFLRTVHIFRSWDMPYQTQLVPLAAILAHIGPLWEEASARAKLTRWFWCGIFGELYGSAVDSRFAKDIVEVPNWLEGGPEPASVTEGVFRIERLRAMRTRQSAAYKGVTALLMAEGAKDWRTGQTLIDTTFFDEDVDIHHIFPKAWYARAGKDAKLGDSIINKTPLGFRTNRILGGNAPSDYLTKLKADSGHSVDELLRTHLINPQLLRGDDFEAFINDRETRLLALIARATGHRVANDPALEEGEEADPEQEAA